MKARKFHRLNTDFSIIEIITAEVTEKLDDYDSVEFSSNENLSNGEIVILNDIPFIITNTKYIKNNANEYQGYEFAYRANESIVMGINVKNSPIPTEINYLLGNTFGTYNFPDADTLLATVDAEIWNCNDLFKYLNEVKAYTIQFNYNITDNYVYTSVNIEKQDENHIDDIQSLILSVDVNSDLLADFPEDNLVNEINFRLNQAGELEVISDFLNNAYLQDDELYIDYNQTVNTLSFVERILSSTDYQYTIELDSSQLATAIYPSLSGGVAMQQWGTINISPGTVLHYVNEDGEQEGEAITAIFNKDNGSYFMYYLDYENNDFGDYGDNYFINVDAQNKLKFKELNVNEESPINVYLAMQEEYVKMFESAIKIDVEINNILEEMEIGTIVTMKFKEAYNLLSKGEDVKAVSTQILEKKYSIIDENNKGNIEYTTSDDGINIKALVKGQLQSLKNIMISRG